MIINKIIYKAIAYQNKIKNKKNKNQQLNKRKIYFMIFNKIIYKAITYQKNKRMKKINS